MVNGKREKGLKGKSNIYLVAVKQPIATKLQPPQKHGALRFKVVLVAGCDNKLKKLHDERDMYKQCGCIRMRKRYTVTATRNQNTTQTMWLKGLNWLQCGCLGCGK